MVFIFLWITANHSFSKQFRLNLSLLLPLVYDVKTALLQGIRFWTAWAFLCLYPCMRKRSSNAFLKIFSCLKIVDKNQSLTKDNGLEYFIGTFNFILILN